MIEIIGLIISQASLAHFIRYNQKINARADAVALVMYLLAAVLMVAWWGLSPGYTMRPEELVFGLVVGLTGVGSYFIMQPGIRMLGVAIMQSIGRLSIAIPVVASIWIWREWPSSFQTVGLFLVAITIPVLARTSVLPQPVSSPWKIPLILAHFLSMGSAGVAFKALLEAVPEGVGPGFYLVAFGSSLIVTATVMFTNRGRIGKKEVVSGIWMCFLLVGCKVFTVMALATLPGIVVFPVSTAGTIMLSTVLSMLLWGERFRTRAILGLVAALAAILAIQLGGG